MRLPHAGQGDAANGIAALQDGQSRLAACRRGVEENARGRDAAAAAAEAAKTGAREEEARGRASGRVAATAAAAVRDRRTVVSMISDVVVERNQAAMAT
jgi:hypothetical protein